MIKSVKVSSIEDRLKPIVRETLEKLNVIRVKIMNEYGLPVTCTKEVMYEILLTYGTMLFTTAIDVENDVIRFISSIFANLQGGEEEDDTGV